ncbi:MAG TPA: hypothetical protein VK913_09650, partial [Erythrobacter sp.]|nr:hypothetical protein [Erythrobacter sp.]
MPIEGISLDEFRAMPLADVDALLSFGRPITFRMGTAEILAEFNRTGAWLQVNLGHVDNGGEGVLVRLWKLIETYARTKCYVAIDWSVHALTCASPNPRLQQFLRAKGFTEH